MNKENKKIEISQKNIIYIKGIVFGLIATALCVILFSFIMLLFELSYKFAAPFATVSVAVGSFVASFVTAKNIGSKGYLIGIIIGIIVFVIVTVIALAVNKSGITGNTLFHFIIITLASVVGGITGVNYNKNKKYI